MTLTADGSAPETPLWLECCCAETLCALPLTHVVEVMRPQPIMPAAGAPAFILGLSIIRGAPIPVISVAQLLGKSGGGEARFVTIQTSGRHAALAFEAVLGMRKKIAHITALPPLLDGVVHSALSAIAARDADFLLFLSLARLVSLAEPLMPEVAISS
jgi:purine-binding chemotaxis protein CheW